MIGVLLMAYGSPQGPDDLVRYYTHIRHGRAPSAEELDNLRMRYDAIGGFSPLTAMTQGQGKGLQEALDSSEPGRFRVFLGLKHSPPFISTAIRQMASDGVDHFIALVLAPHYSSMSVGEYFDEIGRSLEKGNRPMTWHGIHSWYHFPSFIDLVSERLRRAHKFFFTEAEQRDLVTVFTAHSLPQRIYRMGDPYPAQLRETGELVAESLGLTRYRFSWQSAGRTREPWMRPDIVETIRALGAEGHKHVLVCPVGFVSDHLEILYDLDIECRRAAQAAGVHMERTSSFNDDSQFTRVLAEIVRKTAECGYGVTKE
ncbi:MAG: ferrochelatase [Firmicutes bacterium]|uniref:Coproporphyrin III ferrochelatase n=1 Tax=Sulfobacillus benefaciens TaxID=453960 RepID=A0A2T2WQE8_9FIRM|nr:ferrochelatase [Bacillota bacterium]MCL5013477.1 ferrochelatase [Bacillota bacterium]PSR24443.1 MAG: ferrochelatase [Sulfobacillus benefaciens]